jgi:hypothetical protein
MTMLISAVVDFTDLSGIIPNPELPIKITPN